MRFFFVRGGGGSTEMCLSLALRPYYTSPKRKSKARRGEEKKRLSLFLSSSSVRLSSIFSP